MLDNNCIDSDTVWKRIDHRQTVLYNKSIYFYDISSSRVFGLVVSTENGTPVNSSDSSHNRFPAAWLVAKASNGRTLQSL